MWVYNQDTPIGYIKRNRKGEFRWNIQKKKSCTLAAKAMQPMRKRAQTAPKKKPKRSAAAVINRLSRIEGQIRGIRGMVEKSAYCPDILVQVAAANAALNAFTKELLANHIKTCVADDIRAGNDEVIDELVTTLQKLMR